MSERLIAELGRLAEEFARDADPNGSANLARVAEHIAKGFGVKPDEVAILAFIERDKVLKFVVPEKLQTVGTIPMTSATALAVRTARDKKPEAVNNFAATRHASVFEGVPIGRRHGELIHKIMSAPILLDGKLAGVVQISRKGRTPADAGPDFTAKNLRELTQVAGALGQFLKLWQVAK